MPRGARERGWATHRRPRRAAVCCWIHVSMSARRKRHCPRTLNAGISPRWAIHRVDGLVRDLQQGSDPRTVRISSLIRAGPGGGRQKLPAVARIRSRMDGQQAPGCVVVRIFRCARHPAAAPLGRTSLGLRWCSWSNSFRPQVDLAGRREWISLRPPPRENAISTGTEERSRRGAGNLAGPPLRATVSSGAPAPSASGSESPQRRERDLVGRLQDRRTP